MAKTAIDSNTFLYPMPVALVGSLVAGRPNFLAVGWASRVNYQPPLIAIALGKTHYTNKGIHASGAFTVNIPSVDLMAKVDYCGLASGKTKDKAGLFKVVPGQVTGSPMIDDCPLCMECRLFKVVELPSNDLFIGEIVGAYVDADCCTEGQPDIAKIRPFTLSMPDNRYWAMGASIGKAWSVGRKVAR